jgi:SHS2 domain-containing protein
MGRGRAQQTGWRHFDHDADIGIEATGPTAEAAFAAAAEGMTAIVCDPVSVVDRESVAIACEAPTLELLFVDWLNALVFEMATRQMLFRRFNVRIDGTTLTAEAWGEPVNIARHQPAVEIKGATYTALKVDRGSDGIWTVRCVVDV